MFQESILSARNIHGSHVNGRNQGHWLRSSRRIGLSKWYAVFNIEYVDLFVSRMSHYLNLIESAWFMEILILKSFRRYD